MGSARMDKGPAEVLRILREGGTDEEIQEALLFSRESFRAKWGCYPEELTAVTVDVEVDPDSGEG